MNASQAASNTVSTVDSSPLLLTLLAMAVLDVILLLWILNPFGAGMRHASTYAPGIQAVPAVSGAMAAMDDSQKPSPFAGAAVVRAHGRAKI